MSEAKRRANAKTYLDWVLARVMDQQPRMPALGGAMVLNGSTVYIGIRGVRKKGNASAAQIDDRFQLGSITKPMTGYLLAVLRTQGRIDWDRSIGQTWPDLIAALPAQIKDKAAAINADADQWVAHCRDLSITALMTHSSGFDYMPATETDAKLAAISATLDAQLPAKRKLYTKLAMQDQPYHGWSSMKGAPPVKYSGGCIVAAGMAEAEMGRSWEQLMREQFFGPLGITRFALANASSKTTVTDLWVHSVDGNGNINAAAIPPETQIGYTHGPAGAVSLSLGDWAKWGASILRSSGDAHLSMASLESYYELPDADYNCTRGGWFGANGVYGHDGSNGWNYASMVVDRNRRLATLAATNISFAGVTDGIYLLRTEMEALADAWPAMEHLHEALALSEVNCSADSTAGDPGQYHPTLMADSWFRTQWRSNVNKPTITATLQSEGWVKGLALCQAEVARVQQFELELRDAGGAVSATFSGAALEALTTREGLVIKVLFETPQRAKKIVWKVTTSTGKPRASKLMVMAYNAARAVAFDISATGKLWLVDTEQRVLATSAALTDKPVLMDPGVGGSARAVRRAAGKPWLIGTDGRLWRGESNGWFAVAASPAGLKRIAADTQGDAVWVLDSADAVRKHLPASNSWIVHPGGGKGLDICAFDGKAWVVGLDQAVWASWSGGWNRLPGASPFLRRVAVDESNGTLWALGIDNRIFHRASGASAWTEHAGGGLGVEITAHAGLPYVIGMDQGIWKSAGSAGWRRLEVIQPRG